MRTRRWYHPDLVVLLLLSAAWSLFHVLTNGGYGFHRDELDILMNAQHLDWGFVAYPPLTPFLARITYELFGLSLTGMRLFPALAQGVVLLLVGWMARDFGASRRWQILAALAAAIAPIALISGTMIQYMSFDYLWWVLLSFCFVRLLASDDPRWWLGVGAAIGLGLMTKYTLVFFLAGLAAGVLLTSARRWLASRWLWLGAALALLIVLPNLLWQIQNGFITLEFLSAIHARDLAWGRADDFLPAQLYTSANPVTLPLWLAGLGVCLFAPGWRRFRLLAVAFVVTFFLMLIMRGRSYYLAPAYPMLIAAGAAWFEQRLAGLAPRWAGAAWAAAWSLLAIGALAGILLSKPVVPVGSAVWDISSEINETLVEMIGWPELAEQVAGVAASLSAEERAGLGILVGNYGEAGAITFYGPQYGLPTPISGSNSMWARGYGDPAPETVIVVGFDASDVLPYFRTCRSAGRVTNRYNVANEETSFHNMLYVCKEPRRSWAEMWPEMQWFQ